MRPLPGAPRPQSRSRGIYHSSGCSRLRVGFGPAGGSRSRQRWQPAAMFCYPPRWLDVWRGVARGNEQSSPLLYDMFSVVPCTSECVSLMCGNECDRRPRRHWYHVSGFMPALCPDLNRPGVRNYVVCPEKGWQRRVRPQWCLIIWALITSRGRLSSSLACSPSRSLVQNTES